MFFKVPHKHPQEFAGKQGVMLSSIKVPEHGVPISYRAESSGNWSETRGAMPL